MQGNAKKWFVLVTRSRAEKSVHRQLTESGIESYLPLQRCLRVWHDRKKWVESPLLSQYVFVRVEPQKRSTVFSLTGIVCYVSFSGRIAELPDEEIERIRHLCRYMGEVAIEQTENMACGDEVEVLAGHFKGFRGRIVRLKGKERLCIAIEGLSCCAAIEVEREMVYKRLP